MIKKKQPQNKKNEQKKIFTTFFTDLDLQMKGFARELKSMKEEEAQSTEKVS
ncbi:hypothetical protein AAEX28_06475 [Lentisphaerota bacterium WC36G]|nr:hypothetical protein LJT99_09340 [Lentisphaerae bacterium WC36]